MTVDEALKVAREYPRRDYFDQTAADAIEALDAEVRRLRAECDLRRDDHLNACKKIDRLNDKLARVEALAKRWKRDTSRPGGASCQTDMARERWRQCGLDLDEALKND